MNPATTSDDCLKPKKGAAEGGDTEGGDFKALVQTPEALEPVCSSCSGRMKLFQSQRGS